MRRVEESLRLPRQAAAENGDEQDAEVDIAGAELAAASHVVQLQLPSAESALSRLRRIWLALTLLERAAAVRRGRELMEAMTPGDRRAALHRAMDGVVASLADLSEAN